MNEATKQFFVKYHLGQVNTSDYVNWAIDGLEDGLDSKSLRLLAGMDKNHSIKTDFEDLFSQSLNELNWEYIYKRDSLFRYAKDIANKILSGEIDSEKGVESIRKIYEELGYPTELEIWDLLYDGHSHRWYDKSFWLPFIQKYNHERWLEAVNLEAIDLAKIDFS